MCLRLVFPRERDWNRGLSVGVYLRGDSREKDWGTARVKQGRRQSQCKGELLKEPLWIVGTQFQWDLLRIIESYPPEGWEAEAFILWLLFPSSQGMPSVLSGFSRKTEPVMCVCVYAKKFIIEISLCDYGASQVPRSAGWVVKLETQESWWCYFLSEGKTGDPGRVNVSFQV